MKGHRKKAMLKNILGIIAGLATGVIVIMLVEGLGHMIYPPPEGTDLKDPEALKAIMHTIPLGAKIAVLVAWGLGVFTGGYVAGRIAENKTYPTLIVTMLLFAGAAATLIMIPHPLWMVIGAILVTIAGLGLAKKAL